MTEEQAELNRLAKIAIDCAYGIHTELGPGLFEKAYRRIMADVLAKERGLTVEQEKVVPVVFRGVTYSRAYKVDLLIENKVMLELKSREKIDPIHYKQLLSYMKLYPCKLGYLINFGAFYLKAGIKRLVWQFDQECALDP